MARLLQAALNAREHPAEPRTPPELAAEARASVAAGARSLHFHAYDGEGRQTFEAGATAAALDAVRGACPGIPLSMSTSAEIEPDPERRGARIARWTALPDLVSANQGEEGIAELCEQLMRRGVGIEAGLLSVADAHAFVEREIAPRCTRVLIESLRSDPDDAVADAAEMERVVTAAGIALEQVHHGDGIASWAVNRRGAARGHGIRTGLEDTPVLPDGREAAGNAELVEAAAALLSEIQAEGA